MRRHGAAALLVLLATSAGAARAAGQAQADAVLEGRVLVGDAPMTSGTVVLHQVSDARQGAVDSTRVGRDGAFTLRLPGIPNPALGELYFAAVRHQGVMYFGNAIEQAVQLDSLYEIQAWDTVSAPPEGAPLALAGRNLFFEASGDAWRITDVFQVRNDLDRTLVARPGGRVWSYPLPEAATEVETGEGELSADVVTYQEGSIVVRAALPPGERIFVVRYALASPEVSIPTPGTTELFDVLVREPAPALEFSGLAAAEPVELEGGGTYRHYAAEDVATAALAVTLGEEQRPPPVQWIAVILAAALGAGGLVALRSTSRPRMAGGHGRQSLLVELARLDEEFQGESAPTEEAKREYQKRRAGLMRRLRARA